MYNKVLVFFAIPLMAKVWRFMTMRAPAMSGAVSVPHGNGRMHPALMAPARRYKLSHP